jgi:hypothetical protein
MAILKTDSSILGIILASNGQQISILGLVFTSISFNLRSSSIMKSYPKTSKVFIRLYGSIFFSAARKVSRTKARIYGKKSL